MSVPSADRWSTSTASEGVSNVRSMTEPLNALDSLTVVATNLHSSPGVYTVLLGSGISTGAGMKTAWGVVAELVRRYAACDPEHGLKAADDAASDPEGWWAEHGDGGPLTYSSIL